MDSEEPPNVRVACSGDIDEVVRLMHDAAAWMSAKGTPAWDVARIDRTFAETFVLRSELLVASCSDGIVGCCTLSAEDRTDGTMTDFKWRHFQGDVILWAVRWYCRYPISYRDLEEMLAERGISVDHTTIYRWVQCYAPEMEKRLRWFWRRGFDPS